MTFTAFMVSSGGVPMKKRPWYIRQIFIDFSSNMASNSLSATANKGHSEYAGNDPIENKDAHTCGLLTADQIPARVQPQACRGDEFCTSISFGEGDNGFPVGLG